MTKTETLRQELEVMTAKANHMTEKADHMTAKANQLQEQLDSIIDSRPFEVIVERIDETNKYLLVIPSQNYSAQLIRRDRNTLVATSDYVHSPEEMQSNEAVQELIARKHRFDDAQSAS